MSHVQAAGVMSRGELRPPRRKGDSPGSRAFACGGVVLNRLKKGRMNDNPDQILSNEVLQTISDHTHQGMGNGRVGVFGRTSKART